MIGWALDRTLEDELTIAALRMALENRSPAPVWCIIPTAASSTLPATTPVC